MSPFEEGEPPDQKPKTGNEWGILVIISFFFSLMLGLELAENFTVKKLSVPFFLFSWVILLVIHEFGHALMARVLGWKVILVSIGTGQVRARKMILGMPVEFRTIPLSGFASPRATDLIAPRLKQCLIYAAGPGVEILCVLVLGFLLGFDKLLSPSYSVGIIAAQSFCVAALLGVVINLIPFPHQTENGVAWSDGLGMILCWKLPDEYFERQIHGTRA